jgi:HlyD family secretion protein
MPKWLLIFGVLVVLLVGGAWLVVRQQAPATRFRTVPVARGDLVATIGATGTLEPEQVVDVGAQVNGQIISFGPDEDHPGKTIDNRSNVEQGMLLAKIDDRPYQFALEDAKAGVDSAQANITKANADLGQMQAKLFQAEQDWNRVDKLGAANAGISDQERDQYKANLLIAQANVADQQAVIDQAKTTLAQNKAALLQAQQNVDYCTIVSPVKGTVIARRMNAGQTVNSSMSAPSLFLIAKDLRRMQVWASVNEADVGNIHAGQTVTFTVDARPGQTFKGVVDKVRYDASMTQNVVTYTVEITVDNSDGKLLPYLTANVKFELDRRDHAQTVPNSALRWMPRDDQILPGSDDDRADAAAASAVTPTTQQTAEEEMRDRGTVWLPAGDGKVRPVRVKVGVTDGMVTEIAPLDATALPDETPVVTGEADAGDPGSGGTSNPFLPQFGKHKH